MDSDEAEEEGSEDEFEDEEEEGKDWDELEEEAKRYLISSMSAVLLVFDHLTEGICAASAAC